MLNKIEPRGAKYLFNSMLEVGEYINATPRTWKANQSRDNYASRDWDLGLGYDGAVRLAREGWLEGAERAQDALKSFRAQSPMPDQKVDFFGHMPHVPRYCAGAPDSMFRHTTPPTIGGGKVITLYVAINCNCMQDAEYLANYGVGVAQYINQLENDGMRVELYACTAQQYFGKAYGRVSHVIKLKSADQPLDLAVITFAIGHPASFRRIWFALMERSAAREQRGYYEPVRVKPSDILEFPPHAYILNGMLNANTNARTPKQALEHIGAEIERAIEQQSEGVI